MSRQVKNLDLILFCPDDPLIEVVTPEFEESNRFPKLHFPADDLGMHVLRFVSKTVERAANHEYGNDPLFWILISEGRELAGFETTAEKLAEFHARYENLVFMRIVDGEVVVAPPGRRSQDARSTVSPT